MPKTFTNPIICAIDTPDLSQASKLASNLKDHVGAIKLGLEFFTMHGPEGVQAIINQEVPIFLDLKFHDIPNTVAGAIKSACNLNVQMLTIHAAGGPEMIKRAVHTAEEISWTLGKPKPAIIAVTVLTSMNQPDLINIGVDLPLQDHALRLGELAMKEGADGVVCSPFEIKTLRSHLGQEAILVVPGIRPLNHAADDQKRVTTPDKAIAQGADYLVIGRPITKAENPVEATKILKNSLAA